MVLKKLCNFLLYMLFVLLLTRHIEDTLSVQVHDNHRWMVSTLRTGVCVAVSCQGFKMHVCMEHCGLAGEDLIFSFLQDLNCSAYSMVCLVK